MSQGNRFNEGKPKWSLVPQSSLIPMVQVLGWCGPYKGFIPYRYMIDNNLI